MFQRGDVVRAERAAPSAGTWPRFAGRIYHVARLTSREVGVSKSPGDDDARLWFLPSELVLVKRVAEPRQRRPRRRSTQSGT
jgi:hypothetical protein